MVLDHTHALPGQHCDLNNIVILNNTGELPNLRLNPKSTVPVHTRAHPTLAESIIMAQ
jgi:hypothetical protein